MNLIWISQVPRIVFVLKTNFYNYFSIFNPFWTEPRFLVSTGALAQVNPRHRLLLIRTAGYFYINRGALLLNRATERVSTIPSRPIWIQRTGLDLVFNESVSDLVHRISDQGLRSIMRTIRSLPYVNNPTARTSPSRTGILWFDQDRPGIIRPPVALTPSPTSRRGATSTLRRHTRRSCDFGHREALILPQICPIQCEQQDRQSERVFTLGYGGSCPDHAKVKFRGGAWLRREIPVDVGSPSLSRKYGRITRTPAQPHDHVSGTEHPRKGV
jgi:hypothetical protein